jgi:hypothetical protein
VRHPPGLNQAASYVVLDTCERISVPVVRDNYRADFQTLSASAACMALAAARLKASGMAITGTALAPGKLLSF